jgi:anti-sigma factor RsiW
MTDCPNAEIRDRLPDLLHERLEQSARAAVMAHVETCADCRAELMLLRETQVAFSSGARTVDVAAIARGVMARVRPQAAIPPRHRSWANWRLAAAVAFIAIGGASFAAIRLIQRHDTTPPPVGEVAAAPAVPIMPSVGATTSATPTRTGVTPRVVAAPNAELSAAGGVGDLSESDLRTLLHDLDKMDAEPLTEPEPVTVRVAPADPGSSE